MNTPLLLMKTFARRSLILIGFLLSVVANPTRAQGCQNQICGVSAGCFRCDNFSGFFCSIGRFRCAKECTEGLCSPASSTPTLFPAPTSSSILSGGNPSLSEESCLDQIKKTGPIPLKPIQGTGVLAAWQKDSPAV